MTSKILLTVALPLLASASMGTLSLFGYRWSVPDRSDWTVTDQNGAPMLTLSNPRGPLPGPRRPAQFALAATADLSNFTLEADVKPLARSLMLVFSYRDEAHFDYAHLSIDTGTSQPAHNGIFHVYGGERVRISSPAGPPAFPATRRWYHVRLSHTGSGAVEVEVDGKAVPALRAVDVSLVAGRTGLGSFDETAEFRNVEIENRAER